MAWDRKEAIEHYQAQGAPGDQNALVELLREIQREQGGGIPPDALTEAAERLGIRESYLRAVVKRFPSLRLADTHCLEICGGPNCAKRAALTAFVEKTWGTNPRGIQIRTVPCLRMCGKGPNIRWDGKLYSQADEALLRRLIGEGKRPG